MQVDFDSFSMYADEISLLYLEVTFTLNIHLNTEENFEIFLWWEYN